MISSFNVNGFTPFELVFAITVVKDFFHFEIFYRGIQKKATPISGQNVWMILLFVASLIVTAFLASVEWRGWLCGWLVILVWEMLNSIPVKLPRKGS